MIADYEDLEESEAAEIYVKKFNDQEVFVKEHYEISCANGTLRLLGRPKPSSTAEGNLEREADVEIEEGDIKGNQTEDSSSMSGEFIYRHHEEHRLTSYDPDNETYPIPLKYADVMRQTQTSINNVS